MRVKYSQCGTGARSTICSSPAQKSPNRDKAKEIISLRLENMVCHISSACVELVLLWSVMNLGSGDTSLQTIWRYYTDV